MGFLADLFRREPDGPCGFEMPDARVVTAIRTWDDVQGRAEPRAVPPAGLTYGGAHAAEAHALFSALPEKVRRIPVTAVEVRNGGTAAKRNLKNKWLGFYYWDDRLTVVEWSPLTFIHEVFHGVAVYGLTVKQWQDWEAFWRVARSRFPERGRASASEGWAEGAAHLYAKEPGAVDAGIEAKIRGLLE
jgi:hypothetical protein